MATWVLLREPFGRLRNHLVHGLITGINGGPRTAGPGARELMAEARVGRPRAVSLSDSDYLQRSDACDDTSKVKRWTEGYHSAAVSWSVIRSAFMITLSRLCRGKLREKAAFQWSAAMSTFDSDAFSGILNFTSMRGKIQLACWKSLRHRDKPQHIYS